MIMKPPIKFLPRSVYSEKRNEYRKEAERLAQKNGMTATVEYYNPENFFAKDGFERAEGVIKDFGNEGMCLLLNTPIQPTLPVFIQIHPSSPHSSEPLRGYHAEVKWCRKSAEHTPSCYQIGIKFFESIRTSEVL